ncbi:ADP-ribosylglycohydrolase family protein [Kaistella rhinocerotis]|uniref:ADP-ribosylglycohydrolase family protein n=1 Tax=Kaistella rhinocerotis TaxID=3026437 RepID=UPI0025530253|nr:ADP-ribosylglycohydrolase family protein [Kaistella sp. Ran72]
MRNTIVGAIAGDIIGSRFEFNNYKSKNFKLFSDKCTFTDDTVLTIAVADALMNQRDMAETVKAYGRKYPNRGYGGMFSNWLASPSLDPYNSFGNGSAMRASAAGLYGKSLQEAMLCARRSAKITHSHPEGIKGAEAVAAAIYLARVGKTKSQIQDHITLLFGYDLNFTCDGIRETYSFDETCQGTVPQAIVAFLDSSTYEDAIRNAVSIGGDSDTIATITGGIAAAFYRSVPAEIRSFALTKLTPELRRTVHDFEEWCAGKR